MKHGKGTTRHATRDEAYALHRALIAAGEPHLAAVPLICFEWHQRPENVLAGHLTWADWRPADRPNAVRIEHHKNGAEVWMPLTDREGPLFPELTAYMDGLARLGVSVVLRRPARSADEPAAQFSLRDARKRVRLAAKAAGLPNDLSLAACRHGGLTELGDADLNEQNVMSLSGHRTPDAARLYVKRTERQRVTAARKRRAWVEAERVESERTGVECQNAAPAAMSERKG
jgi:integrase